MYGIVNKVLDWQLTLAGCISFIRILILCSNTVCYAFLVSISFKLFLVNFFIYLNTLLISCSYLVFIENDGFY